MGITQQNIWAMLRDNANVDIFDINNAGVPTNGAAGTGVGVCGPGSRCIDTTNAQIYYNSGTKASPVWQLGSGVGLIQKVTGSISVANIIGTTAGQFGHANGVVLQAAPGAAIGLELIQANLFYTFAVAAYTGGGNITINWGAGGAALTGLVSAANSVGAASSKALMFVPLSTVAIPVVSNASLNLVTSAAFTQPGTAAGTIVWELVYRTMAVGF